MALDKKVLHFKGYFTEEIIDSPVESERVRFLDIFYYLVDDSVAMSEPQQENSGIVQGKFLTRQRLPLGQGDRLLSWKHLNTAMDLMVYSKVPVSLSFYTVKKTDFVAAIYLNSNFLLLLNHPMWSQKFTLRIKNMISTSAT